MVMSAGHVPPGSRRSNPVTASTLRWLRSTWESCEGAAGTTRASAPHTRRPSTLITHNWHPTAANNLGRRLYEQGDIEGARAAWQQAVDSGHPEHGPPAAYNLGNLLSGQEDFKGAREAYQRAISSGHDQHGPAAAYNLGNLLKKHGDIDDAKAATSRRSVQCTPTLHRRQHGA